MGEILVELCGFLLEILAEGLIQGGFELLAELMGHSFVEPFKRKEQLNPVLAAIGYLLYGAIAGGLSLLLPKMFVIATGWRLANLIITPVLCGGAMALLGRYRSRRGDAAIRLDTFFYGYLFALAMAGVRYVWR